MAGTPEFTVMTLNLMAEGVVTVGYEDWEARRAKCGEVLPALGADIVCVQECINRQQTDLIAAHPAHDHATSDLSGADAEFRARFLAVRNFPLPETGELLTLYRRDAFELIERREAWLSQTPERVSTGLGNITPRALLVLRLRHRASRRELWIANTHVDLRCTEPMARVGARLLDGLFDAAAPALWCGDFNAGLSTPAADAVRGHGWTAPQTVADVYRGERVDHLFRRGPLALLACEVVQSRDYTPPISDHDPVLARFSFDTRSTA